MSYQALARKWRPRDFKGMVGQSHVVQALVNALDSDKLHHAYLFTGTRGVGKTTLARILAKCLNCEAGAGSTPCGTCGACRMSDEGRHPDLIEVDAASRARVDETRDLMDNVQYRPTQGRYKVYLIDEVHMFSGHSFNALLKTLEEPPPHVKFLLATTDPRKLPVTVLSRCLQFNLKRLPPGEITDQLAYILAEENIAFGPEALRLIAVEADGSMRDALSLLDQAIAYCGGRLESSDVRSMLGTVDRAHTLALLTALAAGDGQALMERVAEMAGEVADFDDALSELLSALQRMAVGQVVAGAASGEGTDEVDPILLARKISPEDVQLYYQIGLMGRRDLPFAPDPRSGFEMILLRMLAFRPVTGPQVQARTGTVAPRGPTDSVSLPPEPGPPSWAASRSRSEAVVSPSVGSSEPAPVPHEPSAPHESGVSATAPRGASVTSALPGDPPPDALLPRALPEPVPRSITRESWPRAVSHMNLTGMAGQLAENCIFLDQEDGQVQVCLSPSHVQLGGDRHREKLESALAGYLGKKIRLRIDVSEPDHETPAGLARQSAEARRQATRAAIEADPNVRTLRRTFDARIEGFSETDES